MFGDAFSVPRLFGQKTSQCSSLSAATTERGRRGQEASSFSSSFCSAAKVGENEFSTSGAKCQIYDLRT